MLKYTKIESPTFFVTRTSFYINDLCCDVDIFCKCLEKVYKAFPKEKFEIQTFPKE